MIKNGYASLDDYRNYGIANNEDDATDDAVIERLIEAVSRYIDKKTGRIFYPKVADNYYSVPSGPTLYLNDDMLEIIILVFRDILATDYKEHIPLKIDFNQ